MLCLIRATPVFAAHTHARANAELIEQSLHLFYQQVPHASIAETTTIIVGPHEVFVGVHLRVFEVSGSP